MDPEKREKIIKYKYANVNIKNITKFIDASEDDSVDFETFIPPMDNFKHNIEFIASEYQTILINYLKHIVYEGEIPSGDLEKIKQIIKLYFDRQI
jgi:hypothetical protein